MNEGRVPPYSMEAETACIGSILLNNDVLSKVAAALRTEDFYVDAHRRIYEAISELASSNKPIDIVTLGERLKEKGDLEKIGGAIALNNLTDAVAATANVEHYAGIVRDSAAVRKMIYSAQEVAAKGFSAAMQDPGKYLSESRVAVTEAASALTGTGLPRQVDGDLSQVIRDLEEAEQPKGLVKTGVEPIDQLTGGLFPGLLYVLGGRPSMGKSALGLNIATNVTRNDKKVLYMTPEDTRYFVILRQLARFADVDLTDLVLRNIKPDDWPRIVEGAVQISGKPLWVDDTPSRTADQIRQVVAMHQAQHGTELVVFDHLGEIRDDDNSESKTLATESAVMACRDMAKELNIPFLLLVQLNRGVESRTDKRPTLADLRQSGAIEQIARNVWFIYRRGYYEKDCAEDPDVQLIVAKANHGKTGTIKLWSKLSRMYMRGWEVDRDGPFPEEGSGPYEAPEQATFRDQNDEF